MDAETATDDVTDSIAQIEMHRQIATREAGLAISCRKALRKLQELLDGEKVALERRELNVEHSANIDAVTIEIQRVRKLPRGPGAEASVSRRLRPGQQQVPQPNAGPTPARNKGRRTMGRPGDR